MSEWFQAYVDFIVAVMPYVTWGFVGAGAFFMVKVVIELRRLYLLDKAEKNAVKQGQE